MSLLSSSTHSSPEPEGPRRHLNRRKPHCRRCDKPMAGHRRGSCSPQSDATTPAIDEHSGVESSTPNPNPRPTSHPETRNVPRIPGLETIGTQCASHTPPTRFIQRPQNTTQHIPYVQLPPTPSRVQRPQTTIAQECPFGRPGFHRLPDKSYRPSTESLSDSDSDSDSSLSRRQRRMRLAGKPDPEPIAVIFDSKDLSVADARLSTTKSKYGRYSATINTYTHTPGPGTVLEHKQWTMVGKGADLVTFVQGSTEIWGEKDRLELFDESMDRVGASGEVPEGPPQRQKLNLAIRLAVALLLATLLCLGWVKRNFYDQLESPIVIQEA